MPEIQRELSEQTAGHTLSSVSTVRLVLRSLGFGRPHSLVSGGRGFHDKEWQFKQTLRLPATDFLWAFTACEYSRKERHASFPKLLHLRSISRWNPPLLGVLPDSNSEDLGARLVPQCGPRGWLVPQCRPERAACLCLLHWFYIVGRLCLPSFTPPPDALTE